MKAVAIVGATGAVGQEFCTILGERRFPAKSYRLLASPRSAGKKIPWINGDAPVEALAADSFKGIDIALFSAGGSISKEFGPLAVKAGALVVDNSSAFRMVPDVPLVVPEINAEDARRHKGIIANPNCSTIIMAVVLAPLHRRNPVRRVVVATYQAVSGAGARALEELESQTRSVLAGGKAVPEVLPHPCAFNVFSHNTAIGPDGYNTEETKMIEETRKILGAPGMLIAPTCMRVPVMRAHTEALSIEFERPISEDEVRSILRDAPGVKVVDDRAANRFPMPIDASGQDDVLVGRIRADISIPDGRGVQLLCCGDQLRKGAATNAVQIAEMFV